MRPETSKVVESPCIRNCCLNQQNICLGCFRHLDEIIGWRSFSAEKKQLILINSVTRQRSNND